MLYFGFHFRVFFAGNTFACVIDRGNHRWHLADGRPWVASIRHVHDKIPHLVADIGSPPPASLTYTFTKRRTTKRLSVDRTHRLRTLYARSLVAR